MAIPRSARAAASATVIARPAPNDPAGSAVGRDGLRR